MTESILDRKFAGRFMVEHAAHAALVVVALLLVTVGIVERPFDADEAHHALQSLRIAETGADAYAYDPEREGPVLYFWVAAMFWLLGANDFIARFAAALSGIGLIALAWPLRLLLGRTVAILFAALVLLSPSWIYHFRFLGHDIFFAFFTLAAVCAGLRYAAAGDPRSLYVAAGALGCAACTKSDFYLLVPVLAVAVFATRVQGMRLNGAEDSPNEEPSAKAHEAAPKPARNVLPVLTAACVFVLVWLLFYSSFGQNSAYAGILREPGVVLLPLRQYLNRPVSFDGTNPLVLLLLYEPLILLGAIVGAIVTARNPVDDVPSRFVLWWSVFAVAGVAIWSPATSPAITVALLPLTLLAACGLKALARQGSRKIVWFAAGAVAILSAWIMIGVNHRGPAEISRVVALRSAQPTAEFRSMLKRIEEVTSQMGTGTGTRIIVAAAASGPLRWYLRQYPVHWGGVRAIDAPIVIVEDKPESVEIIDAAAGERYEKIPLNLSASWQPGGGELLANVVPYWLTQRAWTEPETTRLVLYVHRELEPGMAIAKVELKGTVLSTEGSASAAAPAVWGKKGSSKGEFNEPRDLDVDASGNIYVVDSKNNRIQKLNPSGQVVAAWGSAGSEPGQFKEPCGIAIGPDNSVYVADTWNHRIQKFDANGNLRMHWGEGLWGPRGIAVSRDGVVYVTDTGNKRVLAYNATGTLLRTFGEEGKEPGQLVEPVGIDVSDEDEVFVADTGNRRVQVFTKDGVFIREFPVLGWSEFYTEPYLDVREKDVYVTDSTANRFMRYREGNQDGAWGGAGSEPGQLNRPIGIATFGPSIVYVSDTFNHRVQRFVITD